MVIKIWILILALTIVIGTIECQNVPPGVNRYSPDRCKNWKKEWDLNYVCCDDYPRYVGSDQKFRKDKCCGNLNYCKDKQNCCYNAGGPTNFILVESRFDCGRESS